VSFSDSSNSRFKLFSLLAEAYPKTVPSRLLTESMGITRQAVFKLAAALREEGLEIESNPQKGYALNNLYGTDSLSQTLIDYLLKDDHVFTKCVSLPEVNSTQLVIKKLAVQDAPQGIVAVSERQTHGRGRRGREWSSPRGKNLYFSVLLRPKLAYGDIQLLNLAASLAVRGALEEDYGVAAEIKWPNDVLANGKKICGILSEAAGEPDSVYHIVTGVGVNVNLAHEDLSHEIAETATSVFMESGKMAARPLLLARIFSRLSAFIEMLGAKNGKTRLLRFYRENCATLGKEVIIIEDDKKYLGIARDITEQGAIIVSVDGVDKIFAAADVRHLRAA